MNRKLLVVLILISASAPLAHAQAGLAANAGPDKTINVGASTTFDGTGSTGTIVAYNWDFGDGTTSSGSTVTKTFSSSGTFTVTLVVVGNAGSISSDSASVVVRTADTTAPNITHTPPTSSIGGSPINITATITDNIAVSSATLYYNASTDTSYSSTTMTCSGTATNKSCYGLIPSSVTSAAIVHYYVRAQDSASPTNAGTWPANAPTAYVTLTLQDTQPPTLTHTPAESASANTNLNVTATLTDNAAVSAATLTYAFGTNGTFGSSASVTMARSSGTAADGSWYGVINLSSAGSATDVEYYITASDGTNNATSPSNAPQSQHSLGIVSGSAPTITHTATRNGTAGVNLTLTATVTAASGQTLSVIMVRYRAVGATNFTNVTMSGSGTYTGTIPGDNITDAGVEYHIRANDTGGNVARSPSSGLTSPNRVYTPPADVAGLVAARVAGDGVILTWTALSSTASNSVASYKVYRSTDAVTYSLLTTVTGAANASYTDASPLTGLTNAYKVSAVDNYTAEGILSGSSGLLVTPLAPADVAAAPAAPGNLSVTFSTVSGASWYIVSGTQGGTPVTANVTTGSATLSGLTDGTATSVTVTAWSGTNVAGTASSTVSATPIGGAATPTGLAVTRAVGSASLSWTNASSAANPVTGYRVYRNASGSSANFTLLANVSGATTYADAAATNGVVYLYKVGGTNAFGLGTLSSAVTSARTLLPAMPSVTVTAGTLSLLLEWPAVTGSSWYVVDTSASNASYVNAWNVTSPTASVTGSAGATLYVRVTPYNAYNEAGTPAFITGTPQAAASTGGGGSGGGTSVLAVMINNPASGAVITGPITISGAASTSATSVSISIDGSADADAVGTTTWTYAWDNAALANGTHTIRATAHSGTATSTASVSVTLARPPAVTNTTDSTNNTNTTTSTNTTTTNTTATNTTSNTTAAPVFSLANLNAPATLTVGQALTVSADVRNTGDADGATSLTLYVNGVAQGSQGVTVTKGGSTTASLTFTPPSAGVFEVTVKLADGTTIASKLVTVASAVTTPTVTITTPSTPTITTSTTTSTPPASSTPTPATSGRVPGFELVALAGAVLAAAYVLRRKK
ncbi:MAG: PKD domain-containing protein [Candidatus Thermoplasmatota archaeon]